MIRQIKIIFFTEDSYDVEQSNNFFESRKQANLSRILAVTAGVMGCGFRFNAK